MRLLYLTDDTPGLSEIDYLPDQLYHGLVALLGPENVIDFPAKQSYHGEPGDPRVCRYAFPNRHADFNPWQRPDAYDVIVVSTPRTKAVVNWIYLRSQGKPIVVIDGQDDGQITLPLLHDCRLYFKREFPLSENSVAFRNYGVAGDPTAIGPNDGLNRYVLAEHPDFYRGLDPNRDLNEKLRPISFSMEKRLLDLATPKSSDLFFSGKCTHPRRRAALNHLQRLNHPGFDIVIGHVGTREEYLLRLAEARIGLSIQGGGFDCVRYWEIPAAGSLLLSERPTIRIHQDFQHGVNAVFFDRLDRIVPLVEQLLTMPERIAEMARMGREHIRNHHTTEKRAEYFLSEIERVL